MKTHKNIYSASIALVFSLFLYLASVGCDPVDLNPDYPFTITVKNQADSIPLANVKVEVFAPVSDSELRFEGFTDQNGRVHFEHDNNAILVVRALRGKAPNYTWIGCGEIRLKANQIAKTTVYLQPYNGNVVGCYL
ncbi:MAG: hypothetical protein RI842_05690 [Schleiferiaceae bacterium]|nr:hypothetical protein [Schleiferiaceae bacterium]